MQEMADLRIEMQMHSDAQPRSRRRSSGISDLMLENERLQQLVDGLRERLATLANASRECRRESAYDMQELSNARQSMYA